ncbi:MAG: GSCFA domain-containing protein [Bacteroidales bacterium]|nr:GSCFA domain-containing protein [Bacteroidales bacterium]
MQTIKLYTSVPTPRAPFSISHDDPVLLIGSCFTEAMGLRMRSLGFDVHVNPFGILYNPISIGRTLRHCLTDSEIDTSYLVWHDDLWHSWHHHGSFSRSDRQACLDACNAAIHDAHAFLRRCRTIVFTLGSAYCFSLATQASRPANTVVDNAPERCKNDLSRVVGNCHKVPEKEFVKTLLSPDEIMEHLGGQVHDLLEAGFRLVFTVSPVRHGAYGPHGNQLGKASLLLAVEALFSKSDAHKSQLSYFPAYEIMVDELRDYRFYADDLIHPSHMAEELIWQRFQQSHMTEQTMALCDARERENRRAAHRPLREGGRQNYQQFND